MLPSDSQKFMTWSWSDFEPFYRDLNQRALSSTTIMDWLNDWSHLSDVSNEYHERLQVAISVNTADQDAEERYKAYFDQLFPKIMEAEQQLKQKLLDSSLEPDGYEIPLRNMRAETDLFRSENLPLLAEENKFTTEYDKIMGAQTAAWDGEERTIEQMRPVYQESNRSRREQAWRLAADRQLADREAINEVWRKLLDLRRQIAKNAGRTDYRSYRWQEMLRFDYTPADAQSFQNAIEAVVVPASLRCYERRRQRLQLDRLRPWDLDVDPSGLPPLRPFADVNSLKAGASRIFHQVDPVLGGYFDTLVNEDLLDLANRKNKAPGGFCTSFPVAKRPFIFANAVGLHDDLQTLLHEGGHAFHVFESAALSDHLRNVPMEFAEVASMGMELLAAPYLTADQGGFYSPAEAARARIEHLESSICFWPYMAVVDAFQHWVYENPDAAADPLQCDEAWAALWQRFMVGVDWSGLEDIMATGWHRKLHIHTYPFYYIEYGLAQLGAVQVWANALSDQAGAISSYRRALALGGKVSLPELFKAARAQFAFDPGVLQKAVDLLENTVHELESSLQ